MSDTPFNSADYQNHRNKMVQDGISKLKKPQADPNAFLVHKAMTLTDAVRNQIKPILKAGGWKDKEALRATISTLYVQGFDTFDKDELVNICTMLHLELMMETIEASPYGDDKPDLLSGK